MEEAMYLCYTIAETDIKEVARQRVHEGVCCRCCITALNLASSCFRSS